MAQFLDPLETIEISDSVFSIADHPFRYKSDLLPEVITVPIGFYTDFASVPRSLGPIYAMLGDRAHEPAVVHDWLYYSAITTRDNSDAILMEAMKVMDLPSWQRYPIWWGVRLGGWLAWNGHRKSGDPKDGKFAATPNVVNDVH